MRTAEDSTRAMAIADYQLVGAPPEPDLERLAELAALVCGVPTAVINIIDDRFQHQVAAIGFEPSVCDREDSMCAVVFQQGVQVVVPDARLDDRFEHNPFVTGQIARVRFYASTPLITPSGVVIGTLCVFDEVVGGLSPEHAHALEILAHQVVDVLELRRTSIELGRSNEQLAQFAGQISHDLRNPLMAVSGFLELATESPEMANAPEAAEVLARAESAAGRMATMITDLLDFARIGGAQPRRIPIDLPALVESVKEDLHSAIESTRATVILHSWSQPSGDPTLVRALLQNLVANAIKFAHTAGVTPHVDIRCTEVASGWRIEVDDNGPGIPEERRDRVFDLMERAASDDVPGYGIGLSTCRRIVQAHGGSIAIEDSPLGGARVAFTLAR